MINRRVTRKSRFSWLNWTFGPWYAHMGQKHVWGVDLGPYSVVWTTRASTYKRILNP